MTDATLSPCTIIRAPGAPPRRAGLLWPVGATDAELTATQLGIIAADPGYTLALQTSIGGSKSANLADLAGDGDPAPKPNRKVKARP